MKGIEFLLVLVSLTSAAQEFPSFKTVRYNEDYSAIHSDSVQTFYAQLKHYRLWKHDVYLSIGGAVRYQFIKVENEDWGETAESSDAYMLGRHLLHVDLHVAKRLRVFTDFQSSLSWAKRGASPLDQNPLEVHQLFLDYELVTNPRSKLTLRIGRQELLYGAQRLISVRNGPNNRQAFDGLKLIHVAENTSFDFFYNRFVVARFNSFNDVGEKAIQLWGMYGVRRNVAFLGNIDFYYIGFYKAVAVLDDAIGRENRHSLGTRIWKQAEALNLDIEWLYQFGDVGPKKISAWTTSFKATYTFSGKLTPIIGLKTEVISGDRQYDDERINTFNPLFPSGAYFGLAALFGPSNLIDFHPSLSLSFSKRVNFNLDYDVFWRHQKNDGIYTNNGRLIYSGRGNDHLYIGNQFSTDVQFQPWRFVTLSSELKWFVTGTFLKTAGEGKNILFGLVSAEFTF